MLGGADLQKSVLVVDGDDIGRATLRRALIGDSRAPRILEAPDRRAMLALAPRSHAIVLDAQLPSSPLPDALSLLRERLPDRPVVVVSACHDPAAMRLALDMGAISYALKGADPARLRATVQAALDGHGLIDADLVRPVIDRCDAVLRGARERDRAIIESLAAAVEAKDSITSRHVHDVAQLALQLARVVEPALAESEDFLFGCLLHDVGKIGVPEEILGKPGPLTSTEWKVMRRHPEIGERVIRPLGLSPTVGEMVLHHHERWDGDGYPNRLAREQIPLPARIFSVCDALDAMMGSRPYRRPMAPAAAFEEVRREAGRQFDPRIVEALEEGIATDVVELGPGLDACGVSRRAVR